MKGELINIEHPRNSCARIGSLYSLYFDVAQEEYVKCLEVEAINDSKMDDGDKLELSHRATGHAVKSIVFSALCVESAINNYAGFQLGDSYSKMHLQNLDVISKWVVIPKIVCGRSLDKSGAAFGALKRLITARNKLVHNTSKEFNPSDPTLAEKLKNNDADFKVDFENSLKALYLLCMEMDFVVGQMHNPIGTLDIKFCPDLEIPKILRPLFDKCKQIVLKKYS